MRSRTVLVVSQEDLWVRSLETFLHKAGYRVEIARGVSEALRRARNGPDRVMILEDEMEGVKACDLVPLLKGKNGGVQVIVVTSDESLGGVRRLRDAGIFYQAMKPVNQEELASAVACAFDKLDRERPVEWGLFDLLMARRVPA